MNIKSTLAFVAAIVMLAAVQRAHGVFTHYSFDLSFVDTSQGPMRVYRVYANFSEGGDRVLSWVGAPNHITTIKSKACTVMLGGNFFNPGGGGSNTAPFQESIDANAELQWGTFATVGVSIADQGSGPPDGPDVTSLTPGFPNFINSNQLIMNNAGVFIAGTGPGTEQGRADYAGDGDPALRVLLMQLTMPEDDGLSLTIGQLTWQAAGSMSSQFVFDTNFDPLDVTGHCCFPDGLCFFTTQGACLSVGNNTWLGCEPCSNCLPPCAADIAPEGGNGVIDIDDLFVILENWGACGKAECAADVFPEGGDGEVNIDDLTVAILFWGPC